MKLIAAEAAYHDITCEKHGFLVIAEMDDGRKVCRVCVEEMAQALQELLVPIWERLKEAFAPMVQALHDFIERLEDQRDDAP